MLQFDSVSPKGTSQIQFPQQLFGTGQSWQQLARSSEASQFPSPHCAGGGGVVSRTISSIESCAESSQDFMWALMARITYGLMRMRPAMTSKITVVYSIMDWASREENIFL